MSRLRHNRLLNALAILAVISFTAWAFADHLEVKNGSSWLEVKGDANGYLMTGGITNVTLMTSASRGATTASATQTNANYKGLIVYWNVTAFSGTSVQLQLVYVDPLSGQATIQAIGSTKAATGFYTALVYPAGTLATLSLAPLQSQLPANWQIQVAHVSATATYTISADLIP